jgi:hypothetical protein
LFAVVLAGSSTVWWRRRRFDEANGQASARAGSMTTSEVSRRRISANVSSIMSLARACRVPELGHGA